jgi:threonine aldolase
MDFSSDTSAPAHPVIMHALLEANQGAAPSYGADRWSADALEALRNVFETDLEVWMTSSGTAANALGLSCVCPSTSLILCHDEAHIERDERGAPEFFTGGGRLSLLSGAHGRIGADVLQARLRLNRPEFVHETPAAVLSISNLTECGTLYRPHEVRALADLAHDAGLRVHLDGARFANALVSADCSPADLTWRAGVDVMSFGAGKNGAMGCEAILLFGEARSLKGDLLTRAKRSGHMPPKMRFFSGQMLAYLRDGLWLDLARHANASAQALSQALLGFPDAELAHPVDGNEVFVRLPQDAADRLSAAGARFYPWPDGAFRFVCSWATRPDEIEAVRVIASALRAGR